MTSIVGIAAVLAYLFATALLLQRVRRRAAGQEPQTGILAAIGLGLLLHAVSLYPLIASPQGYNFGFFPVASLVFLTIGLIGLLTLFSRQPVHSLLLLLFPQSALAVICALVFDSSYTLRSQMEAGVAAHVAFSIVSMALLTAAAVQSCLLLLHMQLLKERRTRGLIDALPPLQTMESLLFWVLWAGFICLSVALILGGIYVDDLFAQNLAHKTAFSISAWLVFAVLLWGRHYLGWRGRTAVRWTLIGLALLAIGFFGSKLVLELILQRG